MQYRPSLSERKRIFIEDACAGCGGGDAGMNLDPAGDGDVGFSGEADGRGPVSGLDKALGKLKRRKKKNGS